MTGPEEIGQAQARRIALAAQGFARPRPSGPVTAQHLVRTLDRVGVVQIDSVNVFSRSHYVPFFSRLGPYDRALLDAMTGAKPYRAVEYWVHEASLVPLATWALLRWRMDRAHTESWGGMQRVARDHPGMVDAVRAAVAVHGPVTAADLERLLTDDRRARTDHWGWNWTIVKSALEHLFWAGEVTSAGRTTSFARRYVLTETVLGPLAAQRVSEVEARRLLVEIAARAHGVASLRCLADYSRMRVDAARQAVAELVEDGVLRAVRVRGWDRPAWVHAETRWPRRVDARALLSPFDSLVWERARVEALFGFRYRVEIYVPAPQRQYGYYVLPFLLGDALVARVDLKADRAASVLRVQAAWAEPDAPPDVADHLAACLRETAGWVGCDDVAVTGPGDLAPALIDALRMDALRT